MLGDDIGGVQESDSGEEKVARQLVINGQVHGWGTRWITRYLKKMAFLL